MRRPVVSSRITERSVGREEVSVTLSDVRTIDLSATFGFFINKRIRALPYHMRRRLRAWRMSFRVTLLRLLKHVSSWDGVVSSIVTMSFRCMTPREARSMGDGGERSVRIGTGLLTSDHMAFCGEVSDVISSRWRAARIARRRRVFTHQRILSTFYRNNLSRRCWQGKCAFFRSSRFLWKYGFGRYHSLPHNSLKVGGY
jgi:hypothetical protein